MQPHRLARKPLGEETVDVCLGCQALWFDSFESVQLTPGATLALFDAIGKSAAPAHRALPARLPCPRCTDPLALTHDLQRTTRFSYYRCKYGHGRFTPFFQFLREKEFIRPLAPEELARLKAAVRVIRCSSCGAPVDLERETACPYCRAPIAILDPDAVAATIRALAAAETKRTTIDIGMLVDGLLGADRGAAEHNRTGTILSDDPLAGLDLVSLGLAALARVRGQ